LSEALLIAKRIHVKLEPGNLLGLRSTVGLEVDDGNLSSVGAPNEIDAPVHNHPVREAKLYRLFHMFQPREVVAMLT
jgi:hypothetical protein